MGQSSKQFPAHWPDCSPDRPAQAPLGSQVDREGCPLLTLFSLPNLSHDYGFLGPASPNCAPPLSLPYPPNVAILPLGLSPSPQLCDSVPLSTPKSSFKRLASPPSSAQLLTSVPPSLLCPAPCPGPWVRTRRIQGSHGPWGGTGNGATRKDKREKVAGSQVGGGGRKAKGDRRARSCRGLSWVAPPPGRRFPSKVPSEGPFRVAQQQGLESKDE